MTPHAQPMTAEQIERIRELAEKVPQAFVDSWWSVDQLRTKSMCKDDKEFIATCDPQTILALCALAAKGLAMGDRVGYYNTKYGTVFMSMGPPCEIQSGAMESGELVPIYAALSDQAKGLAAQEGER